MFLCQIVFVVLLVYKVTISVQKSKELSAYRLITEHIQNIPIINLQTF